MVIQASADPLTGKRTQLSGSAASEKEAVALERRLRLLAESGVDGRMTIRQLVAEWRQSDPSVAPTTLANYYYSQDKHILPVLGDKRVEEIRPRLVSTFLKHLRDKHGLQPATVRKVRTVLSALMSYAVQMEYVESNAVMKIPPPPLDETERVAPTIDETARILLQAERTDPEFYVYLWVAAEEGGRRGETLGLRWGRVDFDRGTVTIEGCRQHRPRRGQAAATHQVEEAAHDRPLRVRPRPAPRPPRSLGGQAVGSGRRTCHG
ncbi:MAG: phage integrase SAM-like domain-containing protein [Ilumatobacteraceae bacterium]